ncbi:hypothetical protein SKAU_G00416560 [Synaphobranchus kaupii]|uniref:Zinc finger BED domain-containing protein 4 n=1 Tax=Synaphobranchus kaupii TaxID=118154 RepID=A0A9Q1I9Z3_SYNKA|nr:hypothetical protein SKAU_G00416560 [Synaphobranchus kaupii]
MRTKSRKIVAYFRTSTTAKERLTQVQERIGRPSLKMIQEVDTRWNSTFHMLDRLYQQREPVGAALASLNTDLTPLTSQEYEAIGECLRVLSPFQQATVELSEEKRVSGSKVIPLMNMLQRAVDSEGTNMTTLMAGKLAENLVRRLRDTLSNLESLSVMTMATMLDPRFRTHGFFSQSKASEAVTRLKAECATAISYKKPDAAMLMEEKIREQEEQVLAWIKAKDEDIHNQREDWKREKAASEAKMMAWRNREKEGLVRWTYTITVTS